MTGTVLAAAVSRLWMGVISLPQAHAWGYLLLPRRGTDKHDLRRAHGISRAGASRPAFRRAPQAQDRNESRGMAPSAVLSAVF